MALAVLLGCDYLPQGVPYVGEKKALELIAAVNHGSLIDRYLKTPENSISATVMQHAVNGIPLRTIRHVLRVKF